MRKISINKQIPKSTLKKFINSLPKDKKDLVFEHKKKLLNTFRHYSLHCGWIVFFHEGVPDNLVINNSELVIDNTMDKSHVRRAIKAYSKICYEKIFIHKNFNDVHNLSWCITK